MNLILLPLQFFIIFNQARGQRLEVLPVRYAISGRETSLPCSHPSDATFLKWKFHKNGTDFDVDAAQVFPGNIPTIFNEFNTPPGRSELVGGNLIIHEVEVKDEGHYWCEIASPASVTAYSKKYPLHVYVTPQTPQVTGMGNSTLREYQNRTVARCSSEGGKPGAKLRWMNGTTRMTTDSEVFHQENVFRDYLTDTSVDLKIGNPTRYDHNRVFTCVIEHPSYEPPKMLNYSIKVMFHPINVRIWANLTSHIVYCHADAYPAASYHWSIPGGLKGFVGPELYIEELFTLPGYEYFECTAFNGIPPNATTRVRVDDLRYPDGVPGFAGLDWWVWGVILGGVVALIAVIVIVWCCIKRRKAKQKDTSGYKKPIVKRQVVQNSSPSHPTTLPIDMRYNRTPDGREDSFDSRTPSPMNEHKQALIGGVYSKSQENVTLIPSEELRRSRENVFTDNRKSLHASREQLDQAASHIQTLNQSWDVLSKSRQALNDAQDELNYPGPNLRQSREQLYHSREALNREPEHNYPYIDDGPNRSDDENYSRQDEQDGGYRAQPQGYDSRQRGYGDDRTRGYDDRTQGYDDRTQGYGDGTQGYSDSRGGYDDQYYDRQQGYDTYRDDQRYKDYPPSYDNAQYGQNSNYDDRQGYGYNDDRRDYGYRDDQYQQDGYNARIV